MRVLYVNADPGIRPGRKKGAAVHVAALQQAFRELGCEVLALEQKDPVRLENELEALLAAGPVDLLYERYALGADTAARVARAHGVAHILEVNAPLLSEASEHRGVVVGAAERSREARLFEAVNHVFAVSSAVAEHAAELGTTRDRIHVHPNAVDTALFRPRESGAARSRLGLARSAFIVGFHGRLRPWHGFERVVQAARELRERGVDAHVLTVGEGDYEGLLRAGGMGEHSTSLAWVAHEAVPELLACFDVLPLGYAADAPCYFSPLKLAEAMACGVVPVVPDLGDLRELVRHGESGLLYSAGSDEELHECLTLLALDRTLREQLASAASDRARARSWTDVARAALELAHAERVP